MNYVVSYPVCSIATEREPIQSCSPSRDMVPVIDQVIYPIGALEQFLSPVGPSEIDNKVLFL